MSLTQPMHKAPSSAKMQRRQKNKHKRGASEVGRFFQSLLKSEDEPSRQKKKRHPHKKFRSLRLMSPCRELDAEALTEEERLSRLLHTPKPKIKLPDFGSLYDHFVVVGVPDHLNTCPKVLFQFPPRVPVEIPGLADFCFPGGVKSKEIPNSVCKSEMIALLHNQQYLKQPENSFVFLFTDQESQVFYGICVHKEEILEEPPQYMKDILVPPSIQTTTTRCYCLITKFPFFRLHFDFLFSLFAVEHLARLESEAPSILEEEKAEIDVFLSPSIHKKEQRKVPRLLARSDSGSFLLDPRSPRGAKVKEPAPSMPSIVVQASSQEDLSKFIKIKSSKEIMEDSTSNNTSGDSITSDGPAPEELPLPLLNVLPVIDEPIVEDEGSFIVSSSLVKSSYSSPGLSRHAGVRRHLSEGEKGLSHCLDVSADCVNNTNIDFHPCIKAMQSYIGLSIPQKGQKVTFEPSQYLNSITFNRPFFDEEEELFAEWGLPLSLAKLSFSTLCEFISAILLEKKILVYAKSLRVLSALVLAFPPLIKPFTYQSVIIPMLPDKMESFLEAPVPFVVGTTRNPKEMEIPCDVVVLDAPNDFLISPDVIVPLPRWDELKCSSFVNELMSSFSEELPYKTTKVQRQLVDSICTVFETHFDSLFANFHNYTICNMSDPLTPISVFMKDSFLDDIEEEELPFIEPFIETQAFFEYSDQRLRRRDNGE